MKVLIRPTFLLQQYAPLLGVSRKGIDGFMRRGGIKGVSRHRSFYVITQRTYLIEHEVFDIERIPMNDAPPA